MSPLKRSPHTELPPILSGPVDEISDPDSISASAWTPLTNRRSVPPSYVAARWVQVLSARAAGPAAFWSAAPTLIVAAGRSVLVLAYRLYARLLDVSFSIAVRQPLNAVGLSHAS